MKRSKIATLLLTGALSVSMLAAGAVMSFADGEEPATGDDPVPATKTMDDDAVDDEIHQGDSVSNIMKVVKYADGVDTDAENEDPTTFTFVFTKDADKTTGASAITIPDQTVSVKLPNKTDAGAGHSNVYTAKSDDINIGTLFRDATVGKYVYTVTEAESGDKRVDGYGWKNNPEDKVYTLQVFVQDGGKISYTIWDGGKKISDSYDEEQDGSTKINASEFFFNNEYTERGNNDSGAGAKSLVIEKAVTGTNASKTRDFTFSITFTKSDLDESASYVGTIEGETTQTITCTPGTAATFTLHDGQKLEFDNIPAGTYYTVTETQDANYVGEATGKADGQNITKVTAAKGANVVVPNTLIGDDENTLTFTNEYKDITITGLALQAAPYVALIGLALAMMAAYVVLRRRAENN